MQMQGKSVTVIDVAYVIEIKAFRKKYICGLGEFNKEFTQIFYHLMTGKSTKPQRLF